MASTPAHIYVLRLEAGRQVLHGENETKFTVVERFDKHQAGGARCNAAAGPNSTNHSASKRNRRQQSIRRGQSSQDLHGGIR
jgi:hypothetical protein